MTDWLIWLMERLGAPGAGLAVAVESIFPPIPSELVLPLAGFTASQGDLSLVGVLIWTTIGSVVGAVALYGLGAKLGLQRLRRIAARMPLTDVEDIDRTNAWFARHGPKAVFFGRMLPIFRSLISIPAGLSGMPLRTFVLLTAAGSLVWNSALVLGGYALGEQWHRIEEYVGVLQFVIIAVVVGVLAVLVIRRVRRNRHRADSPQQG